MRRGGGAEPEPIPDSEETQRVLGELQNCIEGYHQQWRRWLRFLCLLIAATHIFYGAARVFADTGLFSSHPITLLPLPVAVALFAEGILISMLPTVLIDVFGAVGAKKAALAVLVHLSLWLGVAQSFALPVGRLLVPAFLPPVAWLFGVYLEATMSTGDLEFEELRSMGLRHPKGA